MLFDQPKMFGHDRIFKIFNLAMILLWSYWKKNEIELNTTTSALDSKWFCEQETLKQKKNEVLAGCLSVWTDIICQQLSELTREIENKKRIQKDDANPLYFKICITIKYDPDERLLVLCYFKIHFSKLLPFLIHKEESGPRCNTRRYSEIDRNK